MIVTLFEIMFMGRFSSGVPRAAVELVFKNAPCTFRKMTWSNPASRPRRVHEWNTIHCYHVDQHRRRYRSSTKKQLARACHTKRLKAAMASLHTKQGAHDATLLQCATSHSPFGSLAYIYNNSLVRGTTTPRHRLSSPDLYPLSLCRRPQDYLAPGWGYRW